MTDVGDVADRWLKWRQGRVAETTAVRDAQIVRNLPGWFVSKSPGGVTADDVFQVAAQWSGSRGTRERVLITLKAMFRDLVTNGTIDTNPAAGVKPPKTGTPARIGCPIPWAGVPVLAGRIAADRPDLAEVFVFMCHSGLRWGELAALQVGDVREGRSLMVSRSRPSGFGEKSTKSGRARAVPLDKVARSIAASRTTGRAPGDLLFTTPSGLPLTRRNFHRDTRWVRVLPGHHIHCTRHTAAVHWLGVPGVTVADIQRWLGHGSLETTSAYLRGLSASTRDAALLDALDAEA